MFRTVPFFLLVFAISSFAGCASDDAAQNHNSNVSQETSPQHEKTEVPNAAPA
ncbi:MAG: hypothetical protein GY822_30205 [Deltaproteobacteria bacterium]|nr:hypothetical protein [Deltaproteobacteria bacterium]